MGAVEIARASNVDGSTLAAHFGGSAGQILVRARASVAALEVLALSARATGRVGLVCALVHIDTLGVRVAGVSV